MTHLWVAPAEVGVERKVQAKFVDAHRQHQASKTFSGDIPATDAHQPRKVVTNPGRTSNSLECEDKNERVFDDFERLRPDSLNFANAVELEEKMDSEST